jgi:hypothetical protein
MRAIYLFVLKEFCLLQQIIKLMKYNSLISKIKKIYIKIQENSRSIQIIYSALYKLYSLAIYSSYDSKL